MLKNIKLTSITSSNNNNSTKILLRIRKSLRSFLHCNFIWIQVLREENLWECTCQQWWQLVRNFKYFGNQTNARVSWKMKQLNQNIEQNTEKSHSEHYKTATSKTCEGKSEVWLTYTGTQKCFEINLSLHLRSPQTETTIFPTYHNSFLLKSQLCAQQYKWKPMDDDDCTFRNTVDMRKIFAATERDRDKSRLLAN